MKVHSKCQDTRFEELPRLAECNKMLDLLWELSFNFKQTTPSWQGMMHMMHKGNEHPGQSSVRFLPMIDMYSGDKTCILSTLEFICGLASKHQFAPVVTFDQPLYWKAAEIIKDSPQCSHLKSIVLLLGGFHTFMNLLGAIGTLMEGTGLKDILGVVYGENSVTHMMSGKSVQRAFRGHLLVDKCLNHMVVSDMVNENPEFAAMVEQSEAMYTAIVKGEMPLDSVFTSETWHLKDNRFVPLMSTMNVAPDSLLKVIHCNCSTACKTLRCSCRKYGLPCTTVCGPCQLQECDNPHNKFLPEDLEEEDE